MQRAVRRPANQRFITDDAAPLQIDNGLKQGGQLLFDKDVEARPRCEVYQTKAGKLLLYSPPVLTCTDAPV